MKEHITEALVKAVQDLQTQGIIPPELSPVVKVDPTKDKNHGDFASNIALMLAKPAGMAPRQLAEHLVEQVRKQTTDAIEKLEIAGPGFINVFVASASNFAVLGSIFSQKAQFGRSDHGTGKRIQVEFVSANPTGPLHVGHGRGAAYGACVADLLEAVGYQVDREYYVNDAGRQMNILAASVWLRYLQAHGSGVPFPVNGYKGEYINDIATSLTQRVGTQLIRQDSDLLEGLPADEDAGGDKEVYIDAVISRAKILLVEAYDTVFNAGLEAIVADIRDDLGQFGIAYATWFSEQSVQADIDSAIAELDAKGHIYEEHGALWFRSTSFGDDKDRVVRRDNGETTYFASDIAYHRNKFMRGYDQVINVWGADHHGYIPRVRAALQALGLDDSKLDVRLVQFAILYRGDERVQMSTRSGSFVTLRELREEVGSDACRFFYVTRKAEQHMDFDLELAKSQSSDNPVYYIQYAHARICSVLRKLGSPPSDAELDHGIAALGKSALDSEVDLAKKLAAYPSTLCKSAVNLEPHTLTHYLRELAAAFHTYYNATRVLVDDRATQNARITLSIAVKQVLSNGLNLLGVSAPDEM